MFQTKKFFSLMALTLALAASLIGCGSDPFDDTELSDPEYPIVGIWSFKNNVGEFQFRIDRESIMAKVICGDSEAEGKSSIDLTKETINIKDEIKLNAGGECKIRAIKGKLGYEATDKSLVFFKKEGSMRVGKETFKRISKPHQD